MASTFWALTGRSCSIFSIEKGMEILEVDKQPFKEAVKPVYEKYKSTIGKDLIEAVSNAQ